MAALRAAGAVPIAKTNLPQLMIFTETDNPLYGRTNNPWDWIDPAAAQAAAKPPSSPPALRRSGLATTLRIAAHSGSVLRDHVDPADRGPNADHCAHGLPVGQQEIISQAGPMAKHVEDLALALRGLDRARDPFVNPGPELGDPAAVDVSRVRFATFTDDGEFPVAPAARRAVDEAAQFLIAAGAKPVPWQRPSLRRVNDLFFACLSADRAKAFRRLLRGNRVDRRIRPLLLTAGMPPWLRRIAGAALDALGQHRSALTMRRFASGSADDYWQTVEAMANFRHELLRSLEAADGGPIDLILCPAYAVPAVRHGTTEMMPLPGAYAPLANVSGFPAGIVPVTRVRPGEESDRPASRDLVDRVARETERGSAGLPIAVQVIARPWRDHIALAAMAQIEAAARKQLDYPARPPL